MEGVAFQAIILQYIGAEALMKLQGQLTVYRNVPSSIFKQVSLRVQTKEDFFRQKMGDTIFNIDFKFLYRHHFIFLKAYNFKISE